MLELMTLSPEAPLSAEDARSLVNESQLRGITATPLPDSSRRVVCAIGAFDGVHLGHRGLIACAAAEAGRRGDGLVALTFDPDPADVLGGGARPGSRLLPVEARVRALEAAGAQRVEVIDFTPELSALSHQRFVTDVLCDLMDLDAIVVGTVFRLGAGGAGDVAALSEDGRTAGFDVIGVDLLERGGAPVTASRIRGLVHEGRVEEAAELLGRAHSVRGEVVRGRGEGASFGFPTANVVLDAATCLPDSGVYAGYVTADGVAWPAAINVGRPPTFDDASGAQAPDQAFLEANLLGFDGELYGEQVDVTFLRWLRASRPFDSLEELEATVLGNIDWVRKALGQTGIRLDDSEEASRP